MNKQYKYFVFVKLILNYDICLARYYNFFMFNEARFVVKTSAFKNYFQKCTLKELDLIKQLLYLFVSNMFPCKLNNLKKSNTSFLNLLYLIIIRLSFYMNSVNNRKVSLYIFWSRKFYSKLVHEVCMRAQKQ